MAKQLPSYAEIIKEDPLHLVEVLTDISCVEIPCDISSADEMCRAGNMLGEFTNTYVYLTGVLAFLKILVRNEKHSGNKVAYENMMARRDTVEAMVEIEKQKYNAISRMITARQEANKEIYMV